MRKLRNIVRFVVCFVLGAYLLLLAVLNFSPTQQWLTHEVSQVLGELLHTRVQIERVEVGLFNRVLLHQVRIDDQQQRPLLTAQLVSAKIELRSLFVKPLCLRTVSLLDAEVKLVKDEADKPANYDFIVEALSYKDQKEKPSSLDLCINSVILRRLHISYDENYYAQTPGSFNPHHCEWQQLNANVSLKHLSSEQLKLRVRSLSFQEKSGFRLDNLRFKLLATKHGTTITDFLLQLPHSTLRVDKLEAGYRFGKHGESIWPTLMAEGSIADLTLHSDDLRPLLRRQMPADLHLCMHSEARFSITPQQIVVSQLRLSDADRLLHASLSAVITRHSQSSPTLSFTLHNLDIQPDFTRQLVDELHPDSAMAGLLKRMGKCQVSGQGSYQAQAESRVNLSVLTDAGKLQARLGYAPTHCQAQVTVNEVALSHLMGRADMPSLVSLEARVHADLQPEVTDWKYKVNRAQALLKVNHLMKGEHHLQDLSATATYAQRQLHATLHTVSQAVNLQAELDAEGLPQQLNSLRLNARVQQLIPSQMGLSTPYGDALFKGDVSLVAEQISSSLPEVMLEINDFRMNGAPQGDYKLSHLLASVTPHAGQLHRFDVNSDFLDAEGVGCLNVHEARQGVYRLAGRLLPGLLPAPAHADSDHSRPDPKWQFAATLKRTDVLEKFLGLSVSLKSPFLLNGTLDTGDGRTSVTASTEGLTVSGQELGKTSLYLSGQDSLYQCVLKTQRDFSSHPYDLLLHLNTSDGRLHSQLDWQASGPQAGSFGSFKASTRFSRHTAGALGIETDIHPTSFCMDDSLWHISSGHLAMRPSHLSFSNVKVSHARQSLTVDGSLAQGKRDSVVAHLQDIDVDYILTLVNFDDVSFGGRATGKAVFSKSEGETSLNARLHIPDFRFNDAPMGVADIQGVWDNKNSRILIDADMRMPGTATDGTSVKGYVSPAEKGLQLDIEARRTDLRFLTRYVDGVFGDFAGHATGQVRLYGPFKALDFGGKVKADVQGKMLPTGVAYSLTDGEVLMQPGSFTFSRFKVSDGYDGSGWASGQLRHTHLKKLNYDFQVQADNLLCYDQPESPDMPFYSTTYGSGTIAMRGGPGFFAADIALRPTAPTFFVYTQGPGGSMGTDNPMVRFRERQEPGSRPPGQEGRHPASINPPADPKPAHPAETDIQLNFLIEANPQAELRIITDARTGDALTAFGSGTLRASYHNKGSFEMYGTYRVERGTYKLSIQDVIRKNMALQSGSSLTFTGNPMLADLDLKAVNTLTGVPLADLNYAAGFAQKTARVDCILHIGGKAKSPQVSFDLDFQNISDDEKNMVRQIIATDEDMNRQAIYLLGIGRFYTSNAAENVTGAQQNAAAVRSLLSTTLTGQLNDAISNALGTRSHWSFGTNVTPGTMGWNDLEVDGLLQGRLFNDRLLINGNFGYRDRPTYTSNFVGDFDIRYLLTPKGGASLRAYSETNDRYFTRSSLTTQGVGVTLQHEFTRFSDLFRRMPRQSK